MKLWILYVFFNDAVNLNHFILTDEDIQRSGGGTWGGGCKRGVNVRREYFHSKGKDRRKRGEKDEKTGNKQKIIGG